MVGSARIEPGGGKRSKAPCNCELSPSGISQTFPTNRAGHAWKMRRKSKNARPGNYDSLPWRAFVYRRAIKGVQRYAALLAVRQLIRRNVHPISAAAGLPGLA